MATLPLRDGESLNVIRLGRGKPVVLLHGFGSRGAHWLPNILPYTRQYEFFLPDLRGFGASHVANLEGLDVFETYAHDIQDLVDHFELDDVVLGGVSTGAYTCLTYNQVYGFSRISKYLNIEHGPNSSHCPGKTNGIFGERQEELFSQFNELLELASHAGAQIPYWDLPAADRIRFRNTVALIYRIAMNRWISRRIVELAAQFAEPLLTRYMMPVEKWQTYLKVMQAFMQGRDTRCSLPNIQVPTTLMMGKQSRYFSLDAQQEIAQHVPHAKIVVFEKSGHAPMIDQPIKFQREFGRFLREQ